MTRIPRIKGLTQLAIEYDSDQGDEPKYLALVSHVSKYYSTNGFTYLGFKLSLPDLSYYLNTKEATFQKALIHSTNIFSSLLSGTTQEEISKGLKFLVEALISDAFVDRNRYASLADSLVANTLYSSGKPNVAVVSQYIKTLELGTKQTATLMQLLNYLIPKTTTQIAIFNQPTGPQGQAAMEYLTREEAAKLLEEKAQKALTAEDNLQALQAIYHIEDTPEVRANGGDEKGPIATMVERSDSLNDYLIEDIQAAFLPED